MFGILLPPENTIKESAPMQVESHPHANLFGVILAFFLSGPEKSLPMLSMRCGA